MQRQGSDYEYIGPNHSLPPHMRSDFQQPSARSTPTMNGQTLHNFTCAPQGEDPVLYLGLGVGSKPHIKATYLTPAQVIGYLPWMC